MRTWMMLIALSAILALAAACGSGDDENGDDDVSAADSPTEVVEDSADEAEAQPTPEPTATPEPEPEPTPTEVIEEPEPTETPEPVADEQPQEPATDEESSPISAYLLSLEDLPAGWTQTHDAFGDDSDADESTDEPFEAPCGVEPLDDAIEPVAEAERSFEGTELGPLLMQNLVQMNSSDEVADALRYMRELFGCDEWIETDEFGDEIVYSITPVPFDGVGDDSFAVQIGVSLTDDPEFDLFGDFAFEMVFIQRGHFMSMFMYLDLFGMSDVDFESLVKRGDEKIQEAL